MAIPTVPVVIDLGELGGPLIDGVEFEARLSDWEKTTTGLLVSTKPVRGVTASGGVLTLNVFPNAPAPDGLGTRGTSMIFRASPPKSRPINVQVQVPNVNCFLTDLIPADGSAGDAAQAALMQIQNAVLAANRARDDAQAALAAVLAAAVGGNRTTKQFPADPLPHTLNGGLPVVAIAHVFYNGVRVDDGDYTLSPSVGSVLFAPDILNAAGRIDYIWV